MRVVSKKPQVQYILSLSYLIEMSLKKKAQSLRKNSTLAEQKLWMLLRNRRFHGYKFKRQYWILERYIVDFICLEKKLIVELDGSQHMQQTKYDSKRTTELEKLGYFLVRYWNNYVLNEIELVLEDIYRHLSRF